MARPLLRRRHRDHRWRECWSPASDDPLLLSFCVHLDPLRRESPAQSLRASIGVRTAVTGGIDDPLVVDEFV